MKVISSHLDSLFDESFSIHEVGMTLTSEHRSKIKSRLQSLEARAPAISSIYLKFVTEEKEIKGQLSINGAGRKFISTIRGDNPWEIYKKLEKDIDSQLMRWKKTRFLDGYIDLPVESEHQYEQEVMPYEKTLE